MPNFDRYSRQILVDRIGPAGQQKLAESRVLIVGIGGLGCQVSAQLAGAGVGCLDLIDHDCIEASNLHRQILFREADIGKSKASVAGREIAAINSAIKVTAKQARVNTDNVRELIAEVDLVVDAADNFATSYLLSDACLGRPVPLLSASVNRNFGYLGIFCGSRDKPAPSLRAVFPRLPRQQMNCDTVGVTGPSVGIIASLQAQEALKVLLDDPQQLLGKLLYADLWQYRLHSVDFSSAAEPPAGQIEMISRAQLTVADTVIDVRSADEIRLAPQAFAVHLQIPLGALSSQLAAIPAAGRIVCACASGQRALIAAQQLVDHGYGCVAALLPASD